MKRPRVDEPDASESQLAPSPPPAPGSSDGCGGGGDLGSMTAEGEPVGHAADLGHQQIEIGGGEPPAIQDTHFQPGTLLEWADGSQEETKYAGTLCAEPTRALHCRGAGKPWPLCHACYCEWGASTYSDWDSNVDGNASDDAEMKEAVVDDGPNEDRHERSIVEQQDAATKHSDEQAKATAEAGEEHTDGEADAHGGQGGRADDRIDQGQAQDHRLEAERIEATAG